MKQNQVKHCEQCSREIYFEGVCYQCRMRKEREAYLAMPAVQIQQAIQDIIDNIEAVHQWDRVYKSFWGLLAYHDINTATIAQAAFEKGVFYPSAIYRDASAALRDKLIQMISDPTCKNANDILQCLAMCGDEKVQQIFLALDASPPPWRKKLHVDAAVYAECGGWSYGQDGKKIDVVYPDCYVLLPGVSTDTAVQIGNQRAELCPVCSCQTVDILTLDGRDERLAFLGIHGKVTIPICPNCASMCEKIVVHYEIDGDSRMEIIEPFGDENYITEQELAELVGNTLVLSSRQVAPFYACGNDDVCTIGGFADWIQDWQYEQCPDCSKKMKLLAAIPWDAVMDGNEGTLYVEICTSCQTITVFHQQT